MRKELLSLSVVFFLIVGVNNSILAQDASPGPVFKSMGYVYDVPDADFIPDTNQVLKAVFDIERWQDDSSELNPLINSLHRYINMHVRKGFPLKNIHLAFVLHGVSGKDALTNEAYKKRYGVDNPNTEHIKALAEKGVHMYICGQSANYYEYEKSELMPEIKLALSAMTVLTVYQAEGYSLIRF
uniref:DsrE family protein n=1 Tax=uncultured Draconibacterium sp. TaxID=1573823 RepID=UPI0032172E02